MADRCLAARIEQYIRRESVPHAHVTDAAASHLDRLLSFIHVLSCDVNDQCSKHVHVIYVPCVSCGAYIRIK